MSTVAPGQPRSRLKLPWSKAAVVVLLSAVGSSTAAVVHLLDKFSGEILGLVFYQWLPFVILGGLLRTNRNPKRALPVRRANSVAVWLTSLLALLFYIPFAMMDTSRLSMAHPHPGIAFFLAPLWALSPMPFRNSQQ